MQLDFRAVALLLVAAGGLVAGAYALGRKHAEPGAAGAAPVRVAQADAGAKAPPGHPPVGGGAAPAQEREGKVATDPNARFTHFRVGNKNVKSILADGKLLWVGTSGGVIRYDTGSEEFKLFDAKNGLLSNGIFHVGKVQGKVVEIGRAHV